MARRRDYYITPALVIKKNSPLKSSRKTGSRVRFSSENWLFSISKILPRKTNFRADFSLWKKSYFIVSFRGRNSTFTPIQWVESPPSQFPLLNWNSPLCLFWYTLYLLLYWYSNSSSSPCSLLSAMREDVSSIFSTGLFQTPNWQGVCTCTCQD